MVVCCGYIVRFSIAVVYRTLCTVVFGLGSSYSMAASCSTSNHFCVHTSAVLCLGSGYMAARCNFMIGELTGPSIREGHVCDITSEASMSFTGTLFSKASEPSEPSERGPNWPLIRQTDYAGTVGSAPAPLLDRDIALISREIVPTPRSINGN